jgi:hypothetical protein
MATQNVDEISKAVAMKLAEQGYLTPPKKRRPRVNWEALMVREYVDKMYPNNLKWLRHEVGAYNPDDPIQFNSQLRRWADAIIDVDDNILVIEAKMKPTPGAISQVQTYVHLIRETPDLQYYWDKSVFGMILTTWEDPAVKKVANEWGILYEVFQPSFYPEWQEMMKNRFAKPE